MPTFPEWWIWDLSFTAHGLGSSPSRAAEAIVLCVSTNGRGVQEAVRTCVLFQLYSR